MKKNLFFAIAIMATMLFTSCYQVCYENPLPPDRSGGQTVFTGTVGDFSTRITTDELGQSQWSPGDAIGIFALPTGGTFAGSTLTANNHRFFTNVTSGIFTPAIPTADNQIILPPTGNFDFIAYHPHTTPLTGNVLSVNVATTTNPSAALDLLWTRAINPVNTPVVPLAFERRMSQIRVYVRAAQPTTTLPLAGLKAEIDGVLVNATMNLEDGAVTPSTAGTLNATTIVTVSGGYDIALTPWLFVPPQTLNNVYITLETSEREWEDIPVPSQALLPGLRYNIVIYVNADGSRTVVIQDPTNIPGWQDGGNIYVPGVQTPNLPPPTFGVSVTSVTLAGYIGATSTIAVTAPDGVAWSVTENSGGWLDVTTNTLGSGTITLKTEEENDTGAPRKATVTVSLDDDPTEYFEIEVKQGAMPRLLFPGSDFNDWNAFLNNNLTGTPATGTNGLQVHALVSHSDDGGVSGSGALRINTAGVGITSTASMFAARLPDNWYVGASSITFDLKGEANRSFAILMSNGTGTQIGTFVHTWSVGVVGTSGVTAIYAAGNAPYSYNGTIDTNSEWVTITLPLTGIDLSDATRFQIRLGSLSAGANFNLWIDNIIVQ